LTAQRWHQGEVGYYDDDGENGIVYLGEPFVSDYVVIPRTDLTFNGSTFAASTEPARVLRRSGYTRASRGRGAVGTRYV
jgi:hypothetical protein